MNAQYVSLTKRLKEDASLYEENYRKNIIVLNEELSRHLNRCDHVTPDGLRATAGDQCSICLKAVK